MFYEVYRSLLDLTWSFLSFCLFLHSSPIAKQGKIFFQNLFLPFFCPVISVFSIPVWLVILWKQLEITEYRALFRYLWNRKSRGKNKRPEILHCVKNVRVRSYYGLYSPAFGLNTERYSASLHILSECGKIRTRITPNTDTFYAVHTMMKSLFTTEFWSFKWIAITALKVEVLKFQLFEVKKTHKHKTKHLYCFNTKSTTHNV